MGVRLLGYSCSDTEPAAIRFGSIRLGVEICSRTKPCACGVYLGIESHRGFFHDGALVFLDVRVIKSFVRRELFRVRTLQPDGMSSFAGEGLRLILLEDHWQEGRKGSSDLDTYHVCVYSKTDFYV